MCLWIGGGFCSGEGAWVSNGVEFFNKNEVSLCEGENINCRKRTNRNLNPNKLNGISMKRIHLNNPMDINRKFDGNFTSMIEGRRNFILSWFLRLADRLREVSICCGDWTRVLTYTPTLNIKGITGVFLDPPYSDKAGRSGNLYSEESLSVAHDVREWAIASGDNPRFRIVLAGYEGEHDMPESWRKYRWSANGGYANLSKTANNNKHKETLWFSPHCLIHEKEDLIFIESNS